MKKTRKREKRSIRWMQVFFDLLCYLAAGLLILVIYPSNIDQLTTQSRIILMVIGAVCVLGFRLLLGIYRFIWRYAGSVEYIWLILADAAAGRLPIINFITRNCRPGPDGQTPSESLPYLPPHRFYLEFATGVPGVRTDYRSIEICPEATDTLALFDYESPVQ